MDEDVMVPAFVHIAVELITLLIIAGSYMVVLRMPLLLLLPLLLLRHSLPPRQLSSLLQGSLLLFLGRHMMPLCGFTFGIFLSLLTQLRPSQDLQTKRVIGGGMSEEAFIFSMIHLLPLLVPFL
ncbi:uncharacterized protein LOC131227808 [Magnolia sinica]|uniref:uncharacterized protein LOC131227808 n=1 Tax=Magnolia sinica TaxID=86752 RepID=UPI002659FD17|nr:uncharacterized protein LOC131227808 [Magnolia sinica]